MTRCGGWNIDLRLSVCPNRDYFYVDDVGFAADDYCY